MNYKSSKWSKCSQWSTNAHSHIHLIPHQNVSNVILAIFLNL